MSCDHRDNLYCHRTVRDTDDEIKEWAGKLKPSLQSNRIICAKGDKNLFYVVTGSWMLSLGHRSFVSGGRLSGAARPKDCRVEALLGVLRKIETNIRIKVLMID